MAKTVIEFAGVPVGIAVPEAGALRFVAVKFQVFDLDQQRYASLSQLNSAVRSHLAENGRLAA